MSGKSLHSKLKPMTVRSAFWLLTIAAASLNAQVETVPTTRPATPQVPADKEVITTQSGLKYSILKAGTGKTPNPNDKVKVHYSAWVDDGTFIASTVGRPPLEVEVNSLLKGWAEGIRLMAPGARFKLTMPPTLAWGRVGSPPLIPPNATLIYEVELISFEPGLLPLPVPEFPAIDESKFKTTASGLKYRVLKEGAGSRPRIGHLIAAYDTVWLIDGSLVSSSYALGRPEESRVGDLAVAGWIEGIQLMKEGAEYVFLIPSKLAYDSTDSEMIPPNSTLVWRIDLVSVKQGSTPK